jgi:hypothetical protein
MSEQETLIAKLFTLKNDLRQRKGSMSDACKAALAPGTEFSPAEYLAMAYDLEKQIAAQEKYILAIEKQLAELREVE